jgi:flagellar operon protein
MTNNRINNILIPNVSNIPSSKRPVGAPNAGQPPGEFQELLEGEISQVKPEGINLSAHAAKRLQERNITIDGDEFFKLKGAIDKLKIKGGRDSLVITSKAAYIVDVGSNTIVTAIDKDNMAENVFTKIDSTLILN